MGRKAFTSRTHLYLRLNTYAHTHMLIYCHNGAIHQVRMRLIVTFSPNPSFFIRAIQEGRGTGIWRGSGDAVELPRQVFFHPEVLQYGCVATLVRSGDIVFLPHNSKWVAGAICRTRANGLPELLGPTFDRAVEVQARAATQMNELADSLLADHKLATHVTHLRDTSALDGLKKKFHTIFVACGAFYPLRSAYHGDHALPETSSAVSVRVKYIELLEKYWQAIAAKENRVRCDYNATELDEE